MAVQGTLVSCRSLSTTVSCVSSMETIVPLMLPSDSVVLSRTFAPGRTPDGSSDGGD